jgi:hypothetical protein
MMNVVIPRYMSGIDAHMIRKRGFLRINDWEGYGHLENKELKGWENKEDVRVTEMNMRG